MVLFHFAAIEKSPVVSNDTQLARELALMLPVPGALQSGAL
jgi:hypothetical protein